MPGRDPVKIRLSLKCRMPDGTMRLLEGHGYIPSYSMREIELASPDASIHEVASAVLGYVSEWTVERFDTFAYEILSAKRVAPVAMQPGDRVFSDRAAAGNWDGWGNSGPKLEPRVGFELCPKCRVEVLRVSGRRAIAKGEPFIARCPECGWQGDKP